MSILVVPLSACGRRPPDRQCPELLVRVGGGVPAARRTDAGPDALIATLAAVNLQMAEMARSLARA